MTSATGPSPERCEWVHHSDAGQDGHVHPDGQGHRIGGAEATKVTIMVQKSAGQKRTQKASTPNRVTARGSRAIVTPGVTNAGLQIRAVVRCFPLEASASGEVRFCRVSGRPTGTLRVTRTYPGPVRMIVHFAAPSTRGYTAYHEVERRVVKR